MWTLKEIRRSFSGRLIGSEPMKKAICGAALALPPKLINYVVNNIWFISSPDDAWAFTFRGSDIKGQYLVFLSEELLKQPKNKVRFTILHEIGHVVLKHKNSMGFRQTYKEINKQEKEASRFAKTHL